jgi:tetratricopeptide (TPR) repeat protein
MTDPEGAMCPRCGAPLSVGDPSGLCPRCLPSDNPGDNTEVPAGLPSSRGGARRRLTLASAIASVGSSLLERLGIGHRTGQQPAEAVAHLNSGITLLSEGKLDRAAEEFRAAIRLQPADALAQYCLGYALRAQGRPGEALAALLAARDHAPPGSELARRIESALAESDR